MIPDEVQTFVSLLLKAAIEALIPVLVAALIVLARQGWQYIASKLSANQLFVIREVVGVAVRAAEQSALIGLIIDSAEEKKQYAITTVQNMLTKRGITKIDVDEISDWIEAAIREGAQDAGVVFEVTES